MPKPGHVYIYVRPKLTASAAALVATLALAAPAHAVDDPATTFTNKAGEALSHTCRDKGQPEETCNQLPVGKHASPKAVAVHADSWAHRALALQHELANDVPLADAPWVGTHNSFNSPAYGLTPSRGDSNQQLSLTDQLRIDVRSLELDIHFFNGQPRVCHATGEHIGCSTEGGVGPFFDEIATFLDEPSREDQVVLLYLEDHIGNAADYETVTSELERAFGAKLYRSAGGECSPKLPLDLSRADVLAQGAQVIAVASGCGGGGDWSSMVFDWSGDVHSESRPNGFQDFPGCGPDFDRATYDDRIVRYFEDSTFVTSTASTVGAAGTDEGLTPETTAAMMRCGVDLTGFDQLLPDDGRLEASVWSWAEGEPARRRCAVQGDDGRWEAVWCKRGRRPAACRTASGSWLVTQKAVRSKRASAACAKQGAAFAVPRTGYENELLRQAKADEATVWLGHGRAAEGWRALDPR